jgi:hypothetical protein
MPDFLQIFFCFKSDNNDLICQQPVGLEVNMELLDWAVEQAGFFEIHSGNEKLLKNFGSHR